MKKLQFTPVLRHCKKCGDLYQKKVANQIYCPNCSFWIIHKNPMNAQLAEYNLKLKAAADASGNPVIWQRGMPLDGLSERMKKRVEMALNFGI